MTTTPPAPDGTEPTGTPTGTQPTGPVDPAPARAAGALTPRAEAATALVEEFAALMRLVHAYKAQSARRSAHALLFPLAHHGPLRTTALADLVHTDPSTTSRQVAELVTEGLVARQGDPADRRASLIAVTDAGRAVVAAMRAERTEQFSGALADWSVAELRDFTARFRRFREALAGALPTTPSHQEQP